MGKFSLCRRIVICLPSEYGTFDPKLNLNVHAFIVSRVKAFIYVGLYGYGYCEAGKSVMTLFRDRGWDAIIADDLIGMVLGMLSLVVGLITGGFTLIFVDQTSWFDEFIADNSKGNAQILAFM